MEKLSRNKKKGGKSKMYSCNRWVRVGKKAQMTIPKKICKELGIEKGDLFKVELVGKKIRFTPQVLIDKV